MNYYYMLSDIELPKFMKKSLLDTYKEMSKITNRRQYEHLIEHAPSFIFSRTNDFLQAIKTDYIIILVPPDKHYKFEILSYDPYKNRIIINSMEFKRITEERFNQLVMDNYPINVST